MKKRLVSSYKKEQPPKIETYNFTYSVHVLRKNCISEVQGKEDSLKPDAVKHVHFSLQ